MHLKQKSDPVISAWLFYTCQWFKREHELLISLIQGSKDEIFLRNKASKERVPFSWSPKFYATKNRLWNCSPVHRWMQTQDKYCGIQLISGEVCVQPPTYLWEIFTSYLDNNNKINVDFKSHCKACTQRSSNCQRWRGKQWQKSTLPALLCQVLTTSSKF